MAMSGHDEQVIAELERQFTTGDPMERRRRRILRWLLVDLVMIVSGLMACLAGLVLWWPGAAIGGVVVAVCVASTAHVVTLNRAWLVTETNSLLQRAWHRIRVWGRGLRRVLDV